ncbi:MAG: Stp1/IreP family PP2C-type Ser/Thr phosphatase [Lachnospiraceae bacterium]|nr:Stp1/IreP family PP2C-type Ser/Thr phosphatase [Lachnospiraceae bacterium]
MKTFSLTDIGKKRKINQDYVYTSEMPVGPLPNLFIVADGMGGHKAGDYASRCATETIVWSALSADNESIVSILENAFKAANENILKKSLQEEDYNGMGTTLVAATLVDNKLWVANVGDSRLYVVNNKEIRQITRDHSLVEEMVRMGGIRRDQARSHPDKNIITRAVGVMEEIEIDFFQIELNKGDEVLMCTDGLTNMIDDEEIRMIMSGQRDIVGKVEGLINAANNNGGKDNIAAIIIDPFA